MQVGVGWVTLFQVGFPLSASGEDELDWSHLGEELVLSSGHPALRPERWFPCNTYQECGERFSRSAQRLAERRSPPDGTVSGALRAYPKAAQKARKSPFWCGPDWNRTLKSPSTTMRPASSHTTPRPGAVNLLYSPVSVRVRTDPSAL
jgi:hypothetical protein